MIIEFDFQMKNEEKKFCKKSLLMRKVKVAGLLLPLLFSLRYLTLINRNLFLASDKVCCIDNSKLQHFFCHIKDETFHK